MTGSISVLSAQGLKLSHGSPPPTFLIPSYVHPPSKVKGRQNPALCLFLYCTPSKKSLHLRGLEQSVVRSSFRELGKPWSRAWESGRNRAEPPPCAELGPRGESV